MKKGLFFFLFVFYIMTHMAFAEKIPKDIISKFISASTYYTDGKYDQAINNYKDILSHGFESFQVYYNLGNAYFKSGNIGNSILNYEKAKLSAPRDSDLNYNYSFILSKADPLINQPIKSFLPGIIENQLNNFTTGEVVLSLTILLLVLAIYHIVALFFNVEYAFRKRVIILFMILIVINSFFVIYKILNINNLAVVVETTSATFEPRHDATEHFKLPQGSKIKVIKDEFTWLKIKRFDGKQGWVKADFVKKILNNKG